MRVQTFNTYLRQLFGERVQRISLDAGLTCPNRDGQKGRGGCIFCDNRAINPFAGRSLSIREQLEQRVPAARKKYRAEKFLAYFQTFSNTYAPVEKLRRLYYEALQHPGMVGLMVGTRPDCLPDDVLDLLAEIAEQWLVWVELGVQTHRDDVLRRLNRGHTFADSADAIRRLHDRHIPVAAHLILGLPGESRADMKKTAALLAGMNVEGVKLHHLYVVKHTPLEKMFLAREIHLLSEREYIPLAAAALRQFDYPVVVMRFSGDCPDDLLVAPRWSMPKNTLRDRILDALDSE